MMNRFSNVTFVQRSRRSFAALSLFLAPFSLAAMNAWAQATPAGDGPVAVPGDAPAAGAAASAAGAPAWMNLVIFGGMILFMFFFVIRPQQKRQKEHKNFIESLKTGMEVVTASGLIGRITSITDTIVTLDLGSTSVRVLKSTISGELGKPSLQPAR
jgi:preprotein translocase subunit YajC